MIKKYPIWLDEKYTIPLIKKHFVGIRFASYLSDVLLRQQGFLLGCWWRIAFLEYNKKWRYGFSLILKSSDTKPF